MDELEQCARRACGHIGVDPDEDVEVIGCDDLTSAEMEQLRHECGPDGFAELADTVTLMPRWRSMRRDVEKALVSVALLKAAQAAET